MSICSACDPNISFKLMHIKVIHLFYKLILKKIQRQWRLQNVNSDISFMSKGTTERLKFTIYLQTFTFRLCCFTFPLLLAFYFIGYLHQPIY